MDILELQNEKSFIGKSTNGYVVSKFLNEFSSYVIILKKDLNERVFFIRKNVIKAESLLLENDVYEIWDNDFKDAALLTISEILNYDIVISKIGELISKYE